MRLRITLSETDRDEYGGSETLLYDHEAVLDLDAAAMEEIERETGYYLDTYFKCVKLKVKAAWVRRMQAWLAHRQDGNATTWEEFRPKLARATVVEEEPVDPPAGASTPQPS